MKLAKKNCEVSSHFLELVLRNPGKGGRREMRTSLHLFPFLFYVSCTRGIAERPFSKAVFSLSFDLVFFSSSKFHFSLRFFSVSRDRCGGLLLFLGEGSRWKERKRTILSFTWSLRDIPPLSTDCRASFFGSFFRRASKRVLLVPEISSSVDRDT